MSMTIEERVNYIKRVIEADKTHIKFWKEVLPIARSFNGKVLNKRFTTTVDDILHKKEILPRSKHMSDKCFNFSLDIRPKSICMGCRIYTLEHDLANTYLYVDDLPVTDKGNLKMDFNCIIEFILYIFYLFLYNC